MIYIQIVIVAFIVLFIGIIRRSTKSLFRLFDSTEEDITELKARQVILLVGVVIGLSLFVMGLVVLFIVLVGESSKL